MRLSSYLSSVDRQAEHEKLIVYMVGEDYSKEASFRRLLTALPEIEAMAVSLMPDSFIGVEQDNAERGLCLYFTRGTTYGSYRLEMKDFQGWMALFLYTPESTTTPLIEE